MGRPGQRHMNRTETVLLLCTAAVLACAACSSRSVPSHGFEPAAPVTQGAQVSVWAVVVTIDPDNGKPEVSAFTPSTAFEELIAPCTSAEQVADAHRAHLPRRAPVQGRHESTRDAVLESLNQRGEIVCRRIYRVVIDRPIEGPPSGPGKTDWVWITRRETTFYFSAHIPRDGVAAIRVSGWRGVRARSFAIPELQQHFE